MVLWFKFIIPFLLIINAASLKGQELYFQSMAAKLNLPSDECYNVLQDKRGYVWIGTDNGLCCYNGKTVRVYNGKNGLPEKGVYFIKQDNQGCIHLITSGGRILQIIKDSIREFPFNQAFINFRKANKDPHIIYCLNFLENKDLIVSGYGFSYKISVSGKISIINDTADPERTAHEHMDLRNSEPFVIRNVKKAVRAPLQQKMQALDFISGDTLININYPINTRNPDSERILTCQSKEFVFISRGSTLIRLNTHNYKVSMYTFANSILHLSSQSDGLWIGLRKSGLRYYPQPGDLQAVQVGLEGCSVSGICLDREGAVWCTTLEKNVFYCNNKAILHYPKIKELSSRTSFMKATGDTLIASTKFDELLIFYKNKLSNIKIDKLKTGELTDALKFKDHWYICSKGYFLITNKFFTGSDFITSIENGGTNSILQLDTFAGKLCAMSTYGIFRVLGKRHGFDHTKLNSKAKSLVYYSEDQIYVGCLDGVYKVKLSGKGLVKLKGISGEITKLKKISPDEIIVGTKEEGLWLLKNDTLKSIYIANTTTPRIIFDVEQDKGAFIWLATNSGLIRLKKTAEGNYLCTDYNTSHGMLSNNIYDLAIAGGLLYVSTKDGVFSFPKNTDLSNKVAPGIIINSVKVNGEPYKADPAGLYLPYDKNFIEIEFDLLTFKKEENSNILLYQLVGSGDSLKTSPNHSLRFENLSPDTYELVAYALNNNGVRSSHPVRFKFTIYPPFWKTPWFALILLCFTVLLIILIVKLVVKNIRNKEKETTRINKLITESQLSALQAQMNPHFIFNAINSIQNYILKRDEKKAFEYLSTFSKLIRMVLNHSRRTSVSLFHELELLKLYIELEQMRFKNAFSFDLQIAPGIDLHDIEIPAMLIQPYMENAIWHGLMSLGEQRKGQLLLDVSRRDNLLRIIIEDNGIGREQAKKYKETNVTGSLAMQLTGQRIEMINELRGKVGLKVQVSDLKAKDGSACGTRVELFLILEPDEFPYA